MSRKKAVTDNGSPGTRLRSFRKDKNLTQQELADSIGLSQNFLSAVESDKENLSKPVLLLLYNLYRINTKWLINGEGPMYIGWTFSPDSGSQATTWIKKIYSETKVQKVFMISYVERMGTEKGFLFITEEGMYSLAGTATRTDHLGGGRNVYCDILAIIDFYNSPFYKIEIDKTEITDWANMDFAALLSGEKTQDKIVKANIYEELRIINPGKYPERKESSITGWRYQPLDTNFSRDWMQMNIDRSDVARILIISYVNDSGVRTNGFIVEAGSELFSMAGDQSGSHTLFAPGGSNYGHLLSAIEKRGIPLFKLELKKGQTLDLHKAGSALFTRSDAIKVDIDHELRAIDYPPSLRSSSPGLEVSDVEEVTALLKSESGEFIKDLLKILHERRASKNALDGLKSIK